MDDGRSENQAFGSGNYGEASKVIYSNTVDDGVDNPLASMTFRLEWVLWAEGYIDCEEGRFSLLTNIHTYQ